MSRSFIPCIYLLLLLAGVIDARAQSAAVPPPPISFYSPRTVLWLGRTAVLPFRAAQASDADNTLSASTTDASMVEIVRPPALLPGKPRVTCACVPSGPAAPA